jgi:hypothetical protein
MLRMEAGGRISDRDDPIAIFAPSGEQVGLGAAARPSPLCAALRRRRSARSPAALTPLRTHDAPHQAGRPPAKGPTPGRGRGCAAAERQALRLAAVGLWGGGESGARGLAKPSRRKRRRRRRDRTRGWIRRGLSPPDEHAPGAGRRINLGYVRRRISSLRPPDPRRRPYLRHIARPSCLKFRRRRNYRRHCPTPDRLRRPAKGTFLRQDPDERSKCSRSFSSRGRRRHNHAGVNSWTYSACTSIRHPRHLGRMTRHLSIT